MESKNILFRVPKSCCLIHHSFLGSIILFCGPTFFSVVLHPFLWSSIVFLGSIILFCGPASFSVVQHPFLWSGIVFLGSIILFCGPVSSSVVQHPFSVVRSGPFSGEAAITGLKEAPGLKRPRRERPRRWLREALVLFGKPLQHKSVQMMM